MLVSSYRRTLTITSDRKRVQRKFPQKNIVHHAHVVKTNQSSRADCSGGTAQIAATHPSDELAGVHAIYFTAEVACNRLTSQAEFGGEFTGFD